MSNWILTLQGFKSLEEISPKDNFIRVHKSFMVVINKIGRIEKNRITIGEEVIPSSSSFMDSSFMVMKKGH